MATSSPAPVVVKDVGAVVVVDGGESLPEFTTAVLCPICDVMFRSVSFWSYMNNFHIARNVWPRLNFLENHHRLICTWI